MKYQSYEKMYERDIWELKRFLMKFVSTYQMPYFLEWIYLARDLADLRDLVQQHSVMQVRLFHFIKKQFDVTQELEEQLIYMRLLLDWEEEHYQIYRQKMRIYLQSLATSYWTSDIYVLWRHLFSSPKQALKALQWRTDDELQRYFLCEIYLIEENYKKAYTYLKDCRYEGALKQYDSCLKAYSPLKYYLYAQKQTIFTKRKWSDHMWMKKQLKF